MKSRDVKYKTLGLSLTVSLLVLFLSLIYFEPMTIDLCIKRLGIPLGRLLGFIFIGLIAGQCIEIMGWTRQFAVVARPFFKFSNLGNQCSAAFTAAFISGATANAMLLDFYEDHKISKMQLFLSNYINQFPAYFLHLPTTVFIVLPLTGKAGALYFIITFIAVLIRTLCFLAFGRFYLNNTNMLHMENFDSTSGDAQKNSPKNDWAQIISIIKKRLPRRIVNICIWVLPIYTIVFILHINGFFDALNKALSTTITLKFMPVESLSVVILSFAAEFTSGFAAAGALMEAGVLTTKQTVIALLMGNVLAFPIRALRHQLPRYMGIFSPKMGLQLLLSGQAFRVISIILTGLLYYWMV